MERLNLTPDTKVIIPVSCNGKDFDLSFNVEDMTFLNASVQIAETALNLGKEFEENKTNFTKLDEIKKNACKVFTDKFKEFCPKLKEVIGEQTIENLTVWLQLLNIIGKYSDKIKNIKTVLDDITQETSGALDA